MKEKLQRILCAVFRHSNLENDFWGQVTCGRCGDILGDTLAGCYRNPKQVGIGCDCDKCRENYQRLTFIDTFLAEKPQWLGQPEGWSKRKSDEARKALREFAARKQQ